MAFEPGIVTRVVTIGGASSAEAALDLELVAKVSAVAMCEDGSTRPVLLIWEATGWRYESSPHTVTGAAGEAVSFPPLPVSDQSGWRDGETGFLLDVSTPGTHTHLYEIELVTKRGWGEVSRRIIGPFPLPTGDGSPVDADLLIEADTVPGLLVSVPDTWTAQVAQAVAAAGSADDAAQSATNAAAALDAMERLAAVVTPSPAYPGTALRITYPAHLSPAPHMVRLPIGAPA